ncbi:hypothetical protein BCT81_14685 [Vibrio sp. 10N.261.52.A1]|nr:hypothetical protein BCT81_14685 [Vibrio sp. 10N.261.52.A1]
MASASPLAFSHAIDKNAPMRKQTFTGRNGRIIKRSSTANAVYKNNRHFRTGKNMIPKYRVTALNLKLFHFFP